MGAGGRRDYRNTILTNITPGDLRNIRRQDFVVDVNRDHTLLIVVDVYRYRDPLPGPPAETQRYRDDSVFTRAANLHRKPSLQLGSIKPRNYDTERVSLSGDWRWLLHCPETESKKTSGNNS